MTPEQKFKAKVVKYFRAHDWLVINAEMLHCPGFPDVMVMKDKKIFFIEFKSFPKKKKPITPDHRKLVRADQWVWSEKQKCRGFPIFLFIEFSDTFYFARLDGLRLFVNEKLSKILLLIEWHYFKTQFLKKGYEIELKKIKIFVKDA